MLFIIQNVMYPLLFTEQIQLNFVEKGIVIRVIWGCDSSFDVMANVILLIFNVILFTFFFSYDFFALYGKS